MAVEEQAAPPEGAVAMTHEEPPERRRRFADRPWLADVLGAVTAMALAVIGALLSMQAWNGGWSRPIRYGGDALLSLFSIRTIEESGWFLNNDRLGAPFGLDFHDYAVGADNGNFLLMKVLTLGTDWSPYVLNAFFVASFALVALSAYWVLRALAIGRGPSITAAVLFSLVPIHFERGAGHLFLANYWSVPIGVYLFVQLLRGEPLFARWRRTIITLVLCALVASNGIYYAAFTVAFLLVAMLAQLIRTRSVGPVLAGAGAIAAIGAVLAFNLAPTIVYQREHGANDAVAKRQAMESEVYSLRLAQVVLPQPSHRWSWYADQGQKWRLQSGHNGEGAQTPGTIGVIGLILLLVAALVRLAGRPRPGSLLDDERLGAFATGSIAALVISASGGLAVLFSFYVSPQLRASARISIFIAFFALAAIALVLDRWRPRRPGLGRNVAFGALLAAVLAVGWWDQSGKAYVPDWDGIEKVWASDAIYGRSVEAKLGGTGEVLQLPYQPFPEDPAENKMADYDQLRSYLHTNGLKWSYGAMKGRPEDWREELDQLPAGREIDAAVAAGFEGVEVDRFGYEDNGARLERIIERRLGPPAFVSPDGRLAFYDARPSAARQRAAGLAPGVRDAVLEPLQVEYADGFSPPEQNGNRWADQAAEIRIDNPSDRERRARIDVVIGTSSPAQTNVSAPGISTQRFPTDPDGEKVQVTVPVPPGGTTVRFTTAAPVAEAPGDPRRMAQYFVDPKVVDLELLSIPTAARR